MSFRPTRSLVESATYPACYMQRRLQMCIVIGLSMKRYLLTLVVVVVLAVLFKLGQTFVESIFSSESSRNAPEQAQTLVTVRAEIGEGAVFS